MTRSSSPTSRAPRRSARGSIRRTCRTFSAPTHLRCERRSRAKAAPSRSSSATPSWPSSACPWRTRTTRRGRSAPRSECVVGSSELNLDLEQRYGVRLAMRTGVNTGDVVASRERASRGRDGHGRRGERGSAPRADGRRRADPGLRADGSLGPGLPLQRRGAARGPGEVPTRGHGRAPRRRARRAPRRTRAWSPRAACADGRPRPRARAPPLHLRPPRLVGPCPAGDDLRRPRHREESAHARAARMGGCPR